MPFTITHIIAIFPLYPFCKRLSFIGLIIGAIVPDMAIVFISHHVYFFSHSLLGIVAFSFPVGLLLYLYFDKLGKFFAIDMCPLYFRSRLFKYRNEKIQYSFSNIFVISIAIILGASTHVFWDSFTHQWGWFLEVIPQLKQSFSFFSYSFYGYRIVQMLSDIIFLPTIIVIVLYLLSQLKPNKSANNFDNHLSKQLKLIVSLSVIIVALVLAIYYWNLGFVPKTSLFMDWLVSFLRITVILFFIYSLLYRLYLFKKFQV